MLRSLANAFTTAAGAAIIAAAGATLATADPYQPYKGVTLVMNTPAHAHYDAVKKILPEFTKQTGIKVEVDELNYLKLRDKQLLEMTKPKGEYDVITYVVFWKTEYVAKGLLEPLSKFFINPKLADPNYDPEDLIPGYLENIGIAGGKKGYLPGPTGGLYGIPYGSETSVLAYRKDIFEKHKLKVPETYDELIDTSCKIKQLEGGAMGGLTSRGQAGHQVVHAWLLHMAPLGGRIFDDQWQPTFDNAAGVKAAETLKKIVECGPDGITAFGVDEMKNSFMQGKAAMFLDTLQVAAEFEDPSRSKIVGKVGWALHPKGVRRGSQTGGFGIGIPANSTKKDAAFLLVQWLTSKLGDKLVAEAGGSPSRFSTYADPALQKKFPYYAVFGEALKHADPDWRPIITEWNELNAPTFGVALSKIVTGAQTPQQAFAEIMPKVKDIMQKGGYYTWNAPRN